ncbi:MAG: 5-formyltetrahydrofolate cyclo-ligase [Terracoccus sp.]
MVSRPGKRDLRHVARAARAAIAADLDLQVAGRAVSAALLPLVPVGSRVAAYESLPDEPPTGRLIADLLAAGHEVVVPVVLDNWSLDWRYAVSGAVGDRATVARPSRLHRLEERSGSTTQAGPRLGADAVASCAVVIVPALSVDRQGNRLGQGGGCYDRALALRHPEALVLAVLHDGEASEASLPAEAHDERVDGWVTTSGVIELLRGPGSPG